MCMIRPFAIAVLLLVFISSNPVSAADATVSAPVVHAVDVSTLLTKPNPTRADLAAIADPGIHDAIAALDAKTALGLLTSASCSSARLAVAWVKMLDTTLTPADRRMFEGAIFNVYIDVDPIQAKNCFEHAKRDYPTAPTAVVLAADLQQAGWHIAPDEVARLLRPSPRPRPPDLDLHAEADSTPPWPHLIGASWIDALDLVNRTDRDAQEPQMLLILADEHLPLRVRVMAGYAVQLTAMVQAVSKLPPNSSVDAMLAAQMNALDDVHSQGVRLLFNSEAGCDYICAIEYLSRAIGTTVPTSAKVQHLRAIGWKIQDEDVAVVNAQIVTYTLGNAKDAISSWSTGLSAACSGIPMDASSRSATKAAGDF